MTVLAVVIPFLAFIAVITTGVLVSHLLARRRALSEPPTGYKDGMVYDTKTKRLKAVKTNVHYDPVTGKRYLGKTR